MEGEVGGMLKITAQALQQMVEHARRDAPIEACGYLGEQENKVSITVPLTNTDASPEHYSMDPREQFATVRRFRNEGYKLRAVYHSHPASPARMSQEDIRLAADPSLTYVIVSLVGERAEAKAFTVRDGVQEEEILVEG